MNVFFDSSAFVKLYIYEKNSERVKAILSEADGLIVSVLCKPEIVSALCRRKREGELEHGQYRTAMRVLAADLKDVTIVPLRDDVVECAIRALESWPLRASDALQIACAIVWEAQLFISADKQQCVAANGMGLKVELLG